MGLHLLAFSTAPPTIPVVAQITLHQGGVTANLSNLSYEPAKGFQEENTWQVADESLFAEVDAKLKNGPATLRHDGRVFDVTITVLEFDPVPGDEDEANFTIEIGYADGLAKLALALGIQ